MSVEISNISLEELQIKENLSNRTYNICMYNGLINLSKILQYNKEYGDFRKIRSCGFSSNSELKILCSKYRSHFVPLNQSNSNKINKNATIIQIIEKLSISQLSIINNSINLKFNELSVRSRNALLSYLENSVTIDNLKNYIFNHDDFDIKSIRNIGSKSSTEILNYFVWISEQIGIVSRLEGEETLSQELLNSMLINQFSIDLKDLNEEGIEYDFKLGIPLLQIFLKIV